MQDPYISTAISTGSEGLFSIKPLCPSFSLKIAELKDVSAFKSLLIIKFSIFSNSSNGMGKSRYDFLDEMEIKRN